MAGEDDGPLGLADELQGLGQVGRLRRGRDVAQVALGHGPFPIQDGAGLLRVLRDVHQHGAGAAAAGHGEGLAEGGDDVLGPGHQVVVLGDGDGDARDVHFLECVRAQQGRTHLPGDRYQRRGVQHGRGQARHQVRGARAGGGHHHTHAPAGPGVAVRHVHGALLVAHQHVPDGVFGHGIVGGQDGPAGIAEDGVHALAEEALPNELGTGEGSWFGHAFLLHWATVMAPSEALVTVAAYLANTPVR